LPCREVMSGIEGLFSLGLSMAAIPGEAEGGVLKALKAIQDTYEKLQAVMEVLSQLGAIEKAVGKVTDINKLSTSIAALGANDTLEMPSDVDLKLMSQNVQAALANVPSTGGLNQDKANLIAAVNSLVIVGSALVDSQTKASSLLVQMANLNRQKTINSDQQARMSALTNALHLRDSKTPPDINSINLIGTTGQLQYQLRQVLLNLSQTLQLQNGALQFQYFGTPLPITSFTLLNLMTVISSQDQAINNALQKLNPQPQAVPDPIKVIVTNVQARKLSGGQVFQVSIGLDRSEFCNYDMVRIDRVVPNITNIKSTNSGNYEIHLSTQAKPFYDRDYSRTAWTYASDRRQFGPYVYNVQSGAAQFGTGTGTFADKVTHLTPFSDWEISLPNDVQNNQGIAFSGLLVDIELDFYITAHYDDPTRFSAANLKQARVVQSAPMVRGVPFQNNLELFALPSAPVAAPASAPVGRTLTALATPTATSGSAPSLANLEAQMFQNQAVMQKWDAVFSVLVGPVNAFLYQQFQAYIAQLDPKNSDNLMQITAYYCDGVSQFRGVWFTNVTKMVFKLSNPLLEFVPGNDSVTVRQNILSGSINTGTLEVTQTGFDPGKCQLVDGDVNFTAAQATGTLTLSVNGVFENNMQVKLTSTGTLPVPLQPATDYWIVNWASSGGTTTLQLSATAGGTPIALTSAGSGTQTITPDIDWGDPMTVDVSKNPYVIGNVSLTRVSGIVEPPSGQGSASETHTVVLDFPTGAFQLNKFAVNPPNFDPDHHATSISAALANFYATNEIQYQVQTINYTNLSQDAALQPTKFLFNAQNTNAGNNILQMFIATTGAVQQATTLNLNEPVAYDPSNPIPGQSDFMVSLMVSTKLMFQHIFVDSFNQGGTNIQVSAIDPGNDFTAWSAQISQGSVTGNVPFKDSYTIDNTDTQFRITSTSNDLTWSLTGLTFSHSLDSGIALNYSNGTASPPSGGTIINFQYRQWYTSQYSSGWGSWQDASAVAYINMNGAYPLQVTGTGSQQKVTFQNLDPTIQFQQGSDLVPQSGCQCNDNDIKIALLSSLGDNVPGTLKTYLEQITFQPISVFALENLLFPADQLITMKQAVVPGDLLVVGSFLAQVRQKSPTYNVTISAASGAKGSFGGVSFQNGQGTGSVTKTGVLPQFQFTYGPIDPTYGGQVNYSIDIEAGTVSPANLIVVVDQPDPQGSPANVILLPPGYGPITP
jgi:hypothetical protein